MINRMPHPPASLKQGPQGRMIQHNWRKSTLLEERVNKIGLIVSFLQETLQVPAHHVNIQAGSDSATTSPTFLSVLGAKMYENIQKSDSKHFNSQT